MFENEKPTWENIETENMPESLFDEETSTADDVTENQNTEGNAEASETEPAAEGKEKEISFFIADYLKNMGIEPDVYTPLDIEGMKEHPDFWKFHNLEERYNVSAVIPGKDRSRRLMLAAHNDTVAVGNAENWSVDPFGGEIKDGKIWGRGACDDKYGIATILFLVLL